jgi:hypothetical protein
MSVHRSVCLCYISETVRRILIRFGMYVPSDVLGVLNFDIRLTVVTSSLHGVLIEFIKLKSHYTEVSVPTWHKIRISLRSAAFIGNIFRNEK